MNSKIVDWAFKILSTLIIPLFVWGYNLDKQVTTLTTTNEALTKTVETKVGEVKSLTDRVTILETEAKRIKDDIKDALAIKDGVTKNEKSLGEIKVQLGNIDDTLKEVKGLLRSHR